MGNHHHGPNLDPFIGYAVLGSLEANRQSAEYQRQQLNLLRQHQGLPPVPAPDPGPGWAAMFIAYIVTVPFGLLIAVAATIAVWKNVPGGPLIVFAVGYLVLAPVGRWIRRKYEDLTDWAWERRELRHLGR